MNPRTNEFGQPIGPAVEDWQGVSRPEIDSIEGRYVRIEALEPERHVDDLFEAYQPDSDGRSWTYLPYADIETREQLLARLQEFTKASDSIDIALVDRTSDRAIGFCSYLRVFPQIGSIEIGNIYFSAALRGTPAATEAMVLLMKRAFDLGYRRYEWKCDALNEPSIRAAKRLGFRYEGTFRNAIVYKNRSRDTAWYSITDAEWPVLSKLYERWLSPANFDASGKQIGRLSDWTAELR